MHLDAYGLAEGTVVWGSPDWNAVKLDNFDPYRLTLTFSGQLSVPVTVKTSGGATSREDTTEFVSGTADLAKTPPELTFR